MFYIGNGCACVSTSCVNITIDNCHEKANGTNFCVCNFTRIVGCDFDYVVPVTTRQLIEADYTLYHDVPKLQIDISLLEARLRHPDIEKLVQEVNRMAQRMLWQVKHDSENIKSILANAEQVGQLYWWDIFAGHSPKATQVFHYLIHAILITLGGMILLSLLKVCLWYKLNAIVKRRQIIWTMIHVYQSPLSLKLDKKIRKSEEKGGMKQSKVSKKKKRLVRMSLVQCSG